MQTAYAVFDKTNELITLRYDTVMEKDVTMATVSGNVGIGTTNPTSKLDVNGTVKALNFSGQATSLTNIPAPQLTGDIPIASLPPTTQLVEETTFIGSNLEFPPAAMSTYTETLNGAYADGEYRVTQSSELVTTVTYNGWKAFNKDNSTGNEAWLSANRYTVASSIGTHNNTSVLTGSYQGEWVQIQCPYSFILASFSIQARNTTTVGSPRDFRLFGSKDGYTWVQLFDKVDETVFSNNEIRTYTVTNNTTPYNYYRIAINKMNQTATEAFTAIGELRLYSQSTEYFVDATSHNIYADRFLGTFIGDGSSLKLPTTAQLTEETTNITNNTTNTFEFPPTAITSFYQTVTTATYGNGSYFVTSSGDRDAITYQTWRAFNKVNSDVNAWITANRYTVASLIGTHNNASITTAGYQGEWIEMNLPHRINLASFSITNRNTSGERGEPRDFRLFGSIDGMNWVQLFDRVDETPFGAGNITRTYTVTGNTALYNRYRLAINKTNTNTAEQWASIGELRLFASQFVINAPMHTINAKAFTGDNVGIGTTVPTARLHVVQPTASTGDIVRVDDETSDFTPFIIKEDGNIGFGAINPTSKVHIFGSNITATTINQGDVVRLTTLHNKINNESYLNTYDYVHTTGSLTWNNVSTRIQKQVDIVPMGYIEFNPIGGQTGIAFGTGYTPNEKMRIMDTGFIGIGTTNPSARFHVLQPTASTGDIVRVDDETNDTTPFIIKDDGKVGIGTSTPNYKLHVITDGYGLFQQTTSGLVRGGFYTVDAAGSGANMQIGTFTNDVLGFFANSKTPTMFVTESNIGIGINPPTARLHIRQLTAVTGDIVRVDDETNDTTPFIIKDDGKVGIGTAFPEKGLHVVGSTKVDVTSLTVQEFPSAALTGYTSTVSGQTHGNGQYVVSASSERAGYVVNAYEAFDKVVTAGTSTPNTGNGWVPNTSYNSTTGVYEGGNSLGGYSGEWIKIQLPRRVICTSFQINVWRANLFSGEVYYYPTDYRLYGSHDNTTWALVFEKIGDTNTSTVTNSFTNTVPYRYYALVVNKLLVSGGLTPSFCLSELRLYGNEIKENFLIEENKTIIANSEEVNVGIGTTAPLAKTHIVATTGNALCVDGETLFNGNITAYNIWNFAWNTNHVTNNTTTFADAITFPVLKGYVYMVEGNIWWRPITTATVGGKFIFTLDQALSSGGDGFINVNTTTGATSTASRIQNNLSTSQTVVTVATNSLTLPNLLEFKGVFICDAENINNDTFRVKFAMNTASAGAGVRIYAGSTVKYRILRNITAGGVDGNLIHTYLDF